MPRLRLSSVPPRNAPSTTFDAASSLLMQGKEPSCVECDLDCQVPRGLLGHGVAVNRMVIEIGTESEGPKSADVSDPDAVVILMEHRIVLAYRDVTLGGRFVGKGGRVAVVALSETINDQDGA